jgi:hypothetical protein
LSKEREVSKTRENGIGRNIGRNGEVRVSESKSLAAGDFNVKSEARVRAAIERSEVETTEPESGGVGNDL